MFRQPAPRTPCREYEIHGLNRVCSPGCEITVPRDHVLPSSFVIAEMTFDPVMVMSAHRPRRVGSATTCGEESDVNGVLMRLNVFASSELIANITSDVFGSMYATATFPNAAPRCGLPTGAARVSSDQLCPWSWETTIGPILPWFSAGGTQVWTQVMYIVPVESSMAIQ